MASFSRKHFVMAVAVCQHGASKGICIGLLVLGLLLLAACGKNGGDPYSGQNLKVNPPAGSLVLTSNTYAGDALGYMLEKRVTPSNGIITTSLVDLDNLEHSSPLGRISSQQIASRLGQQGFKVIEPRIGQEIKMDVREGEFLLTRDTAQLLNTEYDAYAALVGVYSERGSQIFMSVRVVRLADNSILAAYEYFLPKQGQVAALLGGGSSLGGGSGGSDNISVWARYALRPQASLCK